MGTGDADVAGRSIGNITLLNGYYYRCGPHTIPLLLLCVCVCVRARACVFVCVP
jgi:hypothetical protein